MRLNMMWLCTSSGTQRKNDGMGLGAVSSLESVIAFRQWCISLLKILFTNEVSMIVNIV